MTYIPYMSPLCGHSAHKRQVYRKRHFHPNQDIYQINDKERYMPYDM